MTLCCNYIIMLVRCLLKLCILELITECNEESADYVMFQSHSVINSTKVDFRFLREYCKQKYCILYNVICNFIYFQLFDDAKSNKQIRLGFIGFETLKLRPFYVYLSLNTELRFRKRHSDSMKWSNFYNKILVKVNCRM